MRKTVPMEDVDGNPLERGDEVKAALTTFDGPVWMFGETLTVVRCGDTKVHISTEGNGDRVWRVTPGTLRKKV